MFVTLKSLTTAYEKDVFETDNAAGPLRFPRQSRSVFEDILINRRTIRMNIFECQKYYTITIIEDMRQSYPSELRWAANNRTRFCFCIPRGEIEKCLQKEDI